MIAFVFPGQGSQQAGMGAPWADHPSFELVEEASTVLNRDLTHLLTDADSDALQITRNTQISTFLLSMVALDAVERLGVAPQVCAGHSLGEYAALVAAGGLAFDAGLRLVQERGEAMAVAAEAQPGAMVALLGADLDVARAICDSIPGDLWIANHNSSTQIVLSGTHDAIVQVEERAKEFGVKRVTRLKVGGAFHSPYMEAARDRLSKAITATKFYDLEVPVIANVDAREHVDADEWPGLLADQLTHSVRWEETIQYLRELKPRLVLEVGPGGVLTNLLKRTAPELRILSIATPADLEKLLALVAAEGPMDDWATSHQGERLYGTERLVVAPSSGVFQPEAAACIPGGPIAVGDLLGVIGEAQLRSPFAGTLQGMIALPGERVTAGQPIAWLTTDLQRALAE
jgi:[acyl-carrier-protein] S-malonyltransferase